MRSTSPLSFSTGWGMLPAVPTPRQLRALALLAFIGVAETPRAGRAEETPPANVAAARRHYERARADYEQGGYREAIAELEAAHTLDPSAKDLVFNLAVVHEKLTDVDEALRWFRLYATMNLTTQEQERAEAYIRRLEGAKREVEQKLAAEAPPTPTPTPRPTPPPQLPAAKPAPAPPPVMGRIDGATVTSSGIAAAAFVFGVVMATKSRQDQPQSGFVTGQDGSYSDLDNRTHLAHREAVMADVSFGFFVLGAAAAAYLFLSRPRVAPSVVIGGVTTSASLLSGGGALRLEGTF
jgi:tetratricopeptide (TPR) repeat protein